MQSSYLKATNDTFFELAESIDPGENQEETAAKLKMNCDTYDTPALWQTGSRNLTGQKTLPLIWGTYMKLVTKYQISAINSC
jgi:hypothetical protein